MTERMSISVTCCPKSDKSAKLVYPYTPLPEHNETYRGYPIDGLKSISKSKSWLIQIVSPECGTPPEPLPQFPQQEILCKNREIGYEGCASKCLSAAEEANNSGEAYLGPNDEPPTSDYFFTAGYSSRSAVKLEKTQRTSIYHSLVTGQPVPVRVIKGHDL